LVKTARPEPRFLFTKFSSEAVSYNYFLELTAQPPVLGRASPFWSDLAGLLGEVLDLELSLDLTFDPWEGAGQLRSLSLEGPGLGRLDLACELSGLGPGDDSGLLAALAPARLHHFSLAFQDQGFMVRYYARLAEAAGWKEAEVPARLKEEFLTPLARDLAEEGGISNLPALAEAISAFLNQPENLIFSAEPARPWPLASLVKRNRYDIIKELGITLTVNDRPPVSVVADRDKEE
jgi:hypothetical protein